MFQALHRSVGVISKPMRQSPPSPFPLPPKGGRGFGLFGRRAAHSLPLVLALLLPSLALAQEDFFAGKSMTMLCPSGAGAGYDFYARILAKHLPRFIPGNPQMVVRNMPGGGGVTMSNHLYNLAPKDGTTIAVMDQTVLLNEFLQEGINYKTANFTWIGRLAPALGLVMLYHTAPIHSLAEMKDQEIIFASSGKGSQTYMIPTLMRTLLGYKTRVVMGYEGAAQIYLAMERGEVQARTGTIEALLAGHPDWVETGKIRILAELSLEPQPSLPGLPMLTQLARNPDDRAVLDFIASFTALGFPYAAPPGIPPERALILRRAFDRAVASPELIAEMKRSSMTVGPATGEAMQELTARYSQLSPELLARTKRALEW